MRPAMDMTPAVLEAFADVVREVAALRGEPRFRFNPVWANTDGWWSRRVGATWTIQDANHALVVEERGAQIRRWTVRASRQRGPIRCQELDMEAAPGIQALRHSAGMVGLLDYVPPPDFVEVTRFGDVSPRYVEGADVPQVDMDARCGGWPNGTWHGPDCGNRTEHAPHTLREDMSRPGAVICSGLPQPPFTGCGNPGNHPPHAL